MAATCGLDFERRLSASGFDVRGAITAAMRELGFEITVDQLTRIEAKRGSLLGSSLLLKKQMPILAVFEVTSGESGCSVAGHLTDNMKNFGKTWGVNRQYREVFDEVIGRVDLGLARLDGSAAGSFGEPRFWSRAGDIAVLEGGNALTARAVGKGVGAAGKALEGSTDTTPKAWKGVDSVTFTSSAGVAVLTLAEAQADLGIAVMVVSHPGAMPANLTRDVEAFAASVEQTLTAAGGRAAFVDVSDAQRPVLEFVHQQAGIRSELPMRELHICRSCRLEKITNPEYQRIARRNEKIGDIVAGVGATIGKGGISPTFVLGQVFKLKRLDPEYVCSKCQGMEADERIVTFCPSCAELQRDVVLRLCPKCGFDFRTRAAKASMWAPPVEPEPEADPEPEAAPQAAPTAASDPDPDPAPAASLPTATPDPEPAPRIDPKPAPVVPAPAVPAPAVPAPVAAPVPAAWPHPAQVPLGRPLAGSRGKVCEVCRREFPTLWRIVVQTQAGYEEHFVCGTTTTCQVPSVVTAVQA
jgi:hypothetical protein